MRVLLTGAAGFLGQAIARRLIDAGHAVTAFVRAADARPDPPGLTRHEGDVTSLDMLIAAATGQDAIVHCAARTDAFARIEEYYDANVRGTDNVLAACEIAGVRRLVFTSCAAVVVDRADLAGVDETEPMPTRAPTPYLATKALAERRVLAANGDQLATVALRPHLLWGPGEARWLPRIAALARAGRLRLFGAADAKIDSCYVDNAADAHLAALERLEIGSALAGNAYFISQGEPVAGEAFLNSLLRAAGYPAEMRRLSVPVARVLASTASLRRRVSGTDPLLTPAALALFGQTAWFNIAAARRDLDYTPRVAMAEGFARVSSHLARERMRAR